MSSTPAVDVSSLHVHRGLHKALDDVSLQVPAGSITGLLGPSGCGKTTLMRSVVGTQIIESGTVTVLGEPAGSRGLRRRVGYVTQAPSVYTDLTVTENVAYYAALYGRDRAAVADTIAAVGLAGHAGNTADALSGGQLGRVSLACSLVGDPELLVLDEPTVGLDPVLRAELWEHFRALAARGVTLLVSSHVMDEADHCDALVLLRDGRLVAQLTPRELRDRTGEERLEDAFLHLIRGDAAGTETEGTR
ncbi:MAG: ABC transporter ATP-binding protein [Rhodococcus sp.]|uniref:ABC transporter ATP-binding protein n=1 Tax=Rhodococcus sp. TaxID=1831 RepID=UPI0016AEE2DB|nr:ABC transporter ATP-binding protein [Rhodococcus sp. (in: high G+C Gram-positive bacteria)]NLV80268.1 ABC transporter ATP-binding protein [Rhodococcus sp. (in: high G+C Gram-positive bacteria)]